MKALLLLPLLALCACSGPIRGPNHFGLKPGYEIDATKHFDPVHKYRMEGSVDWNW